MSVDTIVLIPCVGGEHIVEAAFGLKAALYAAENLYRKHGSDAVECRVDMEDGTTLWYDGRDWRGEKP